MLNHEDITKSASNVFLVAKDKDSKFLYCNENFAAGLGLDSPHQIIGKNDYQFFDERHAKSFQSSDSFVLKGGIFLNIQETIPFLNSTAKILTTKNHLRNKDGDLLGIVVSFVNITGLTLALPKELLKFDPTKNCYKFKIGDQSEYFTKREYSVFKYLLIGFTAKQIAEKIGISPRTVEDHIAHIKSKLQCATKSHIPEAAARMGIIQQNIFSD